MHHFSDGSGIFSIPIQAQKVAMFETTLYFEDAVGNMDSIRVGHDTAANSTFNTDFGEEFINAPFDSVFEVRAAHRQGSNLMIWKIYCRKRLLAQQRAHCMQCTNAYSVVNVYYSQFMQNIHQSRFAGILRNFFTHTAALGPICQTTLDQKRLGSGG